MDKVIKYGVMALVCVGVLVAVFRFGIGKKLITGQD